jgi:hypothetical protein
MKLGPHSPDGVNNLSITGERRLADTYIEGYVPNGKPGPVLSSRRVVSAHRLIGRPRHTQRIRRCFGGVASVFIATGKPGVAVLQAVGWLGADYHLAPTLFCREGVGG